MLDRQSVTGNQSGTEQAQVTDPAKSQFGIERVSSNAATGFTREDVEAEVHKLRSELGRQHAEEKRQWQRKQDAAELEAVRENPEAFDSLKARQEARRREDEANQRFADAKDAEERATSALSRAMALEAKSTARELAVKYGVDPTQLLSFTEGKIDKMEDLAKLLPKVSPSVSNPQPQPFKPDSGLTIGGGTLSLENLLKLDIRRMSPAELREHKKNIEAQSRGMPR